MWSMILRVVIDFFLCCIFVFRLLVFNQHFFVFVLDLQENMDMQFSFRDEFICELLVLNSSIYTPIFNGAAISFLLL